MNPFTKVLAAASSDMLYAAGTFFKVKETTAPVKISVPNGGTSGMFDAGEGYEELQPFTELYLENTNAFPVTVEIVVGAGKAVADRLAGEVSAVVVSGSILAEVPDVALNNGAATLLAAANPDRKEIMLQADPANTVTVRIGGATVAAARGFQLPAGAALSLETSAAVYAFAPAAGQKIAPMEVLK